jgi:hypothetical protein
MLTARFVDDMLDYEVDTRPEARVAGPRPCVLYVLEGQEESGPYWLRRASEWETIPRFRRVVAR